jgi:D-lactate dehydrogenase (cytochrome)
MIDRGQRVCPVCLPPRRILFPLTAAQLSAALRDASGRGEPVTLSGGRTGIVGGAVPIGGEDLVALDRLAPLPQLRFSEPVGAWCVTVGPGTTLTQLRAFLASSASPSRNLIYPIDPTEQSATLGGTVATNASGARTLFYGPTRDWVLGLTVVLADGSLVRLRRGEGRARDGRITLAGRELPIPPIAIPHTKHTAGYRVTSDMEPIDLFIGGEGTLGVVAEADLRLCEAPSSILGLCVFLPSRDAAAPFVADLKGSRGLRPLALEYIDGESLRILSEYRREAGEQSGVPALPAGMEGLVFIELASRDEADRESTLAAVNDALSAHGIPQESTWAGFEARELEAMRKMRHALPERINELVARRQAVIPGLTKLATDLAVPDASLQGMLDCYRRVLDDARLERVIFGHIGNAHLHVNILPRDRGEMERGKQACITLARTAVEKGGSVSGEHGIGKLKKELLELQFTPEELAGLRSLKDLLDPQGILNPGVLW